MGYNKVKGFNAVPAVILLCLLSGCHCNREPECSQFHFLEQLLDKMVRTEVKFEEMQKHVDKSLQKVQMALSSVEETNNRRYAEISEIVNAQEEKVTLALEELSAAGTTTQQPNVAFRVMLSKNLGSVSTDQVIIFDEVNLNLGNAYDVRNGIFTAPHKGTYIFSMALGNPTGHPGIFYMKKNEQTIEYAFAGHTTGWNMGGVTTVVELVENDTVRVVGEAFVSGAYPTNRYHTGFSGILVHPYY